MIVSPRPFLLLVLFLALSPALSAQSLLAEETVAALFESTEKVGRKMTNSVMKDRSVTESGQFIFSGSLGNSFIDQIRIDPDISGDKLSGLSFGGSAAYGLTDRLNLLFSLTGSLINGTVEAEFYSELTEDVAASMDFSMVQLLISGSYDVFRIGGLSFPLSLGVMGSLYSLEAELEETALAGTWTGDADALLSSDGFIPGMIAGIGAQYRFSWLAVKAYASFIATFSGMDGESEVILTESSGTAVTYSGGYEIDPYIGGTYGFALELLSSRHWKINLDFTDILPLPGKKESPAEVYSLALTVSYVPFRGQS